MNYFIIPKSHFNIKLNLQTTNKIEPNISHSLFFYINNVYNQIVDLQNNISNDDVININHIKTFINPLEFIHSNVPGTVLSVSKVKPHSIVFFELMELFRTFNINDILTNKHNINIAHMTHNYESTNYLFNMMREHNDDNVISEDFNFNSLFNMFITNTFKCNLDIGIIEFASVDYEDTNKYINNLMLVLLIIIKYQQNQGIFIIKISNIFYKTIIDIIFILSSLYDKVFLVKPSISDITNGERYLVCKGFNKHNIIHNFLLTNKEQLIDKLTISFLKNICISSIIDNHLPYHFRNKLEESNLFFGQQQIDSYDQIISIYKNKCKEDKIENLKRLHIQKCIQWCEKNQLPHNKFIDKVNIFLCQRKNTHDNDEHIDIKTI